ncbi:hypothetical protein STBA_04180 [Streptomyces sp. MP131-18]|nr:hypothetical protein STBA_04180 [Streptomyces sp. MP131-18]
MSPTLSGISWEPADASWSRRRPDMWLPWADSGLNPTTPAGPGFFASECTQLFADEVSAGR